MEALNNKDEWSGMGLGSRELVTFCEGLKLDTMITELDLTSEKTM